MPLPSFRTSRTCSLVFLFCTRLHFRPFRELSAPVWLKKCVDLQA